MNNIFCIFLWCILQTFYNGNLTVGFKCFKSKEPTKFENCCEGYQKINNECIPICKDGCPRSKICLEPDVCGCEDNTLDHSDNRCVMCFGLYSNSSVQHTCVKCKPTYDFITDDYCEPICDQECINGFCYSPGICKCHPGNQENPKTQKCESIHNSFAFEDCLKNNNCQNVSTSTTVQKSTSELKILTTDATSNCQNDCGDGICINGLCEEHTSLTEENTNISISTTQVTINCQNECVGGICKICPNLESTTEQISTSGETLNSSTTNVISNCQNGIYNEEKICKCNHGYILKNGSWCLPQCDRECVNSICVEDHKTDCLNVTCVAINKCQCLDGFFPKPGNPFECVVCSPADMDNYRWKLLNSIWIICILTLSTLILLGCLVYKKMKCGSYNIDKVEKCHRNVVFKNNGQPKCDFS